jgi:hypothetical protein
VASTAQSPAGSDPSPRLSGAEQARGLPSGREVLNRLIALREGSIIVVTIIVAIYF